MRITLQEVENGWIVTIYRSSKNFFEEVRSEEFVAHDYKKVIEILSKLINKG